MKTLSMLVLVLALSAAQQEAKAMDPIVGGGIAAGAGGGAYLIYRFVSGLFDINKILTAAGKEATILGLQEEATLTSPETAQVTASAVNSACVVILEWLPANSGQSADAINAFITTQFASDPVILRYLQKIEPTVQRYVPVSSAFLSPTEIGYIAALVEGIRQGAVQYRDTPAMTVHAKYTTTKQRLHETIKAKVRSNVGHRWFDVQDNGCECK